MMADEIGCGRSRLMDFPPSPYRRVAALENRSDCSAAEMADNALPRRPFYQVRGDCDDAYGLARAVDAEFYE